MGGTTRRSPFNFRKSESLLPKKKEKEDTETTKPKR